MDADTSVLKIGILGGTFDPIHFGHLAIAEEALNRLDLDRVILIPAGRPWLKSDQLVTSAAHRLAMVRLAIQNRPGLEVSTIEVDRPGPTYTVDTLVELRRELGSGVELYLILGMDSVRELRRWRDPERLFGMCTVVAVSRPDSVDVSSAEIEQSVSRCARQGQNNPRPHAGHQCNGHSNARRRRPVDQQLRSAVSPTVHTPAWPVPRRRLVSPHPRD